MSKKSQEELEKPAKVYQLDAVTTQLEQVNNKLDTIVNQTANLATVVQVDAVKSQMTRDLEEAVKDIHNEYKPTLNRIGWLYTTVIGEAIALLGTVAVAIFLTK